MLTLGNKLTLNSQPIYKFVNKYSIDFDGVDDYIQVGDVGRAKSMSFWFKPDAAIDSSSSFQRVFGFSTSYFGISTGSATGSLIGETLTVLPDGNSRTATTRNFDAGEWYHVVISWNESASYYDIYVNGVLETDLTTGTHTLADWSNFRIGAAHDSGAEFDGKLDEVAVYDRTLTQAEITRMYNTYYSPNRIANGNFAQEGVEEVTNGDFSQIGSELVTNGDFATDTGWTKQTGWSIANGSASYDGSGTGYQYILQSITTTSGSIYKINFDVLSSTGSNLNIVDFGSVRVNQTHLSEGNYTYYAQADASSENLVIYANGTDTFSIDNVSVKEVGQDWSVSNSGSASSIITDSYAQLQTSGDLTSLEQTNVTTASKQYKLQYDVLETDGGNLGVVVEGNTVKTIPSSLGSHTEYFAAHSTTLVLKRSSGALDVKLDNISVKEVGQHWTFGTGWSTDGTKAIRTGTTSSSLAQSVSALANKTFKLTFDITDWTVGHLKGQFSGGGGSDNFFDITSIGDGSFSFSAATTINRSSFDFYAYGSFDGSIDNIVIQELKHDATNLMLNAGAYQSANPLITSTKSMEFDGSDDYLQVGDVGSVKSLSFWFNPDNDITASSSEEKLFGFNTTYYGIALGSLTGALTGETLTVIPDNSNKTATTKEFDAGRWYNIVIAWNETASYFDIYVDGVLSTDLNSGSAHTLVDWSNFKIGTDNNLASEFNGQITETGVWDRTLTALEVASLYNQGMPTNLLVNRNNYQSGNPTVFNTKQVDFDGVDDYMEVQDDSSLQLEGSEASWTFWTRLDSLSGGDQKFIAKATTVGGANAAYQIRTDNADLLFQFFSGSWRTATSSSFFTDLNWVNVTVTIDASNIVRIYKNGVETHNSNIGYSIPANTGEMLFGARTPSSPTNFLNGKMSQVGIFSSALTADEVSSLYNHGLPIDLTTDQAAYESSSNLVGYWRMGSGTLDEYPSIGSNTYGVIADQTNATLGDELIVNGDFATDSNWNKGTGWTISGGKARRDGVAAGGNSPISQTVNLVAGKVYKLSYDRTYISNGGETNLYSEFITDGSYTTLGSYNDTTQETVTITSYFSPTYTGSMSLNVYGIGTFTGTVDNVSLKEFGGNPAIMTNMNSSDIENGSPYANIVQNSDFSEDSSDWSVGTGWQILNGKANVNATSFADLTQNIGTIAGTTYRISYEVSNYVTGSVKVMLGYGSTPELPTLTATANGIYTVETTANTTNPQNVYVSTKTATTELSIDNVTVEEVNTGLQGYWKMGDGTNDEYPVIYDQVDPTLGSEVVTNGDFATDLSSWTGQAGRGSYSWDNGKAKITNDDASSYPNLSQSITTVVGKVYKITATVEIGTATLIEVRAYSNSNIGSQQLTTDGTIEFYITADDTDFTLHLYLFETGNTGHYCYYDNVSVKEVQGNPATMTNMLEGNITNQYPLTKIRNYYRMGDGILDGYPIIQDQTSPNLAHIPTTNLLTYSEDFSNAAWSKLAGGTGSLPAITPNNVISPDGTQNASTITFDKGSATGGGDYSLIRLDYGGSDINGTASIYLKSETNVDIEISSDDTNYQSVNVTNEWQRFSIYDATSDRLSLGLRGTVPSNNTATVYAWGAQLEEQNQATAYIKSDGIAAVRKSSTTNEFLYSEDFSQSSWNKSGMTVTSNTSLNPLGISGCFQITESSGSGANLYDNNSNLTTGNLYTVSFYVKSNGQSRDTFRLRIGSNESSVMTATTEWVRYSYTATANSAVWGIRTNGSDLLDVLIWGAQAEQQTQVETYAKTTGLPVTIDLFTENNYGTMTNQSSSDIVEDTP